MPGDGLRAVSWLARLSSVLGLEGLGAEGATSNAADSLRTGQRACWDLEAFLVRFAHPAGHGGDAGIGVGGMTGHVRWQLTGVTDEAAVLFEVPLDGRRRRVAVVGDFNGWDPAATPLVKRGGVLRATVTVRVGRCYEYRFLSVDDWRLRDACEEQGHEPDEVAVGSRVLDLTRALG